MVISQIPVSGKYVNDERKTVLVKPYNWALNWGFIVKPEVYLSFDANTWCIHTAKHMSIQSRLHVYTTT